MSRLLKRFRQVLLGATKKLKKTKFGAFLMKAYRFKGRDLAITMLVFGIVGVFTLLFIHAASPFGTVEPENGTINGAAHVDCDSATSNGTYVRFGGQTQDCNPRIADVVNHHINQPWPPVSGCTAAWGNLGYSIASLWLNKNVADANARLAAVTMNQVAGDGCNGGTITNGNDLVLSYVIRPYYLYYSGSSYFPNRMNSTAQSNLIAQSWAYAQPFGKLSEANADITLIKGSENHDSSANSFYLLAAQMFKNDPAYANRTYADGSTPQQQYQAWHDHWMAYFDMKAKDGLFVEQGAPEYSGFNFNAMVNVYNFAEDPILRKKAEMILDLEFADFAQQNLGNVWGGGKSRTYTDDAYAGGSGDAFSPLSDTLFGPAAPPNINLFTLPLATSGYQPPAVIRSLATDQAGKGVYEYTTRRPGVGPLSWDANTFYHPDMTKSVLQYSYVTPNYVLGTAILDPAQTYIAISAQNRWQGIIFAKDKQARVYPQIGLTDHDNNKTYDNFYGVQKKSAFITRANPDYSTSPTLVYFANNLDTVDEESGWLFVQEGNAYLGVKPVTGGYSWLTASKNKDADINNRFIRLSTTSSPIIFEAAQSSDYASFAAFKTKLASNNINYSGGTLNYTAADGTRLTLFSSATTPQINGTDVNYAPTLDFNSPYMKSTWNSGIINVTYGSQHATYDFSNPNNPVKTTTSSTGD